MGMGVVVVVMMGSRGQGIRGWYGRFEKDVRSDMVGADILKGI